MTLPSENNRETSKTSDPEIKADAPAEAAKVEAAKVEAVKASEPTEAAAPKAPESKASESKAAEAGKALAPAGTSPVNPFLAAASTSEHIAPEIPVPPRPFYSRMLDYSAHAAIIVGLFGFAWTVSGHVVSRPKSDAPVAPVAAAALPPKPVDEMAQLRLANQKMHDEIKALRASVDTLRTAVRRDTSPEQVRMLTAGLDAVKGSISTNTAAIAQLNGKLDKLQPAKVGQLSERISRLEHQSLDPSSTGSIAKNDSAKADSGRDSNRNDSARNVPKPPAKPAAIASNEEPSKADDKPAAISGWVVRDVYQGVALIEGKRGTMEIVPGVAIPGAGVVKTIERKNGSWVVTTSKGQFASASNQPRRDDRRDAYSRGGYGRGYGGGYGGGYRYDY